MTGTERSVILDTDVRAVAAGGTVEVNDEGMRGARVEECEGAADRDAEEEGDDAVGDVENFMADGRDDVLALKNVH